MNLLLATKKFISFANAEFIKAYGKKIPQITKSKHDLFNGTPNSSAGEFIFVYTLVYILIIGFVVLIGVCAWYSVQDIETVQISFNSYNVIGSDVVFVSEIGEEFKIEFIPKEYDLSLIQSVCDGKTRLTVQVTHETEKDDSPYYCIKSIYKENEGILLRSETKSFVVAKSLPLIYFFVFSSLYGQFYF